jgi:DNA-binding NtrC family response regulator
MPKGNILIVDDNKNLLVTLEMLLSPEYGRVRGISNPNLLLSELRENPYHLVLLDMNFKTGINTGNEGLYWLQRVREDFPDISVVLITAYGDVDLAVRALKAGATDFVLKPWDNAKLRATVKSAVQLGLSKMEVKSLRRKEQELISSFNPNGREVVGESAAIQEVLRIVGKVAATDTNILITGENGTGKELIAQRIHQQSNRSHELMVTVDMGAIPESLFESELFGHVKGAFTDARDDRMGKFELANRGTLFLDEIANLPLPLQAKLLVALQGRVITRVGSNQPIPVDIRLIAATNQDLYGLVRKGLFREDLMYRLNTIHIEVPPLRARKDDILILAEFFLRKYSEKYNKLALKIPDRVKEQLQEYSWPGNIRELEHTIEKAVILSDTDMLEVGGHLSNQERNSHIETRGLTLDAMEEKMIRQAIESSAGNIKAAAEQLGISRQTLYNKMRKYAIL